MAVVIHVYSFNNQIVRQITTTAAARPHKQMTCIYLHANVMLTDNV